MNSTSHTGIWMTCAAALLACAITPAIAQQRSPQPRSADLIELPQASRPEPAPVSPAPESPTSGTSTFRVGTPQAPVKAGPAQLPAPTPNVAVGSPRDATDGRSTIYEGYPIKLMLTLRNLPPGRVSVETDKTIHPLNMVQFKSDRSLPAQYTELPYPVAADGSVALPNATVTFAAGVPHRDYTLHLRVIYEGPNSREIKLVTAPLPVAPMVMHTVKLPADIVEKTRFGGMVTSPLRLNPPGCFRPASTLSRDDVGARVRQGILHYRVRNGLHATTCIGETAEHPALPHPWRVTAVSFSNSSSAPRECSVPERLPQYATEGRPAHTIIARTGRLPVAPLGWGTAHMPRLIMALQCKKSLLDDQFVEWRWESVELLGPANANPNQVLTRLPEPPLLSNY